MAYFQSICQRLGTARRISRAPWDNEPEGEERAQSRGEMRRPASITLVGVLLLVLVAGTAQTKPADARTQAAPVRLLADLTCAPVVGLTSS